jgi:glycosyltransferase involved in cell wall biosynthesis
MRTIGVTMVRDEADIIDATVRHMLDEVDAVLVADNLSTDDTPAILRGIQRDHPDRVTIVDDPDPAYRQSDKMTALARRARLELGADWVVPFDADEIWYSPFGRVAEVLEGVAPQWLIVPAPLYDHVATADDDTRVTDPVRRIRWRRPDPNPLRKVACRWRADLVIAQGNHDALYTGRGTYFDPLLVVRHYPYRSVDQLIRKVRNGAAAYAAAGDSVPDDAGAHWRQWGELLEHVGEHAIAEIYSTWYYRARPTQSVTVGDETLAPLVFDPPPIRRP